MSMQIDILFIDLFNNYVGPQLADQLQCLAIQGKIVYASYQNLLKAFKRGQEVNSYVGHEGEIHIILPFGDHLLSIDDRNVMRIWHSISTGVYSKHACTCMTVHMYMCP